MGDCREILPTLSGVDCTVTSPPYNQMDRLAKATERRADLLDIERAVERLSHDRGD